MNIALDYDQTYTRDPDLWNEFILSARIRKHQVFIVTMRYENSEAIPQDVASMVNRVIYTERRGKRAKMQFLQLPIDIWIDDMPDFIIYDAADAMPPSARAAA